MLTPLKRVGGPGEFSPCGWDEALDDIATRLAATKATHGEDSLAIYLGNPGSFATMHYGYALAAFKAMGGHKVFSSFHVDTGAKSLACQFLYGNPLLYSFPDLDDCEMLLMPGATPWCRICR
ncbi:molybdopterin-dependent oxidoreductase [Sphingomonas sp. MMS24-JH45]